MPTRKNPIRLIPIEHDTTLDEAEQIRRTDDPSDFPRSILSESEFMGIVLPKRDFILRNLIMEETITVINGYRGFGKSWMAMAIANEVTWGGKVGPWKVDKSVDTLVIDGEMPLAILQERLGQMNKGRDIKKKPATLYFYPEAYAYRIGLKRANILDPKWRDQVAGTVQMLGIEMLILDNLSSLAPGIDENEKLAFDPVNRWMLEMRFQGVAIVMTHHTGKGGDQRGTSAHEDHVDLSLVLSKPPGYTHDQGCKFTCAATKDRAMVMEGMTYTMQLEETEEGRIEFAVAPTAAEDAVTLLHMNPEATWEEAESMGVSRATFYRAKRIKKGLPPR